MKLADIINGATSDDISRLLTHIDSDKRAILCNSIDISKKPAWEYARLVLYALKRSEVPPINFQHHIVPRCILKRSRVQVDHDTDNLVHFTVLEHWLAHHLLSKASTAMVAVQMANACALIAMDIPSEMACNYNVMLQLDSNEYNHAMFNGMSLSKTPVRYAIRQKNKYRGSMNWYGGVIENGKPPYWFSLLTDSIEKATEWKNEQEDKMRRFLAGESVEVLRIDSILRKNIDIQLESDSYLEYLRTIKKCSHATLESYETFIAKLIAYCRANDKMDMCRFTTNDAEILMNTMTNLAASTRKATINLYKALWKSVMDKYGDTIIYDAWNNIETPKVNSYARPKIYWTAEQMDRILDAAPSMTAKAFWATLRYCGTRNVETMNVRWMDWDRENNTITIRSPKRNRTVPVIASLDKILREYALVATVERPNIEPEDSMFKGLPEYGSHRTRQLQRILTTLGLRGTIETFRASWMNNAMQQDADISTIAAVAGLSRPDKLIRLKKDIKTDEMHRTMAALSL